MEMPAFHQIVLLHVILSVWHVITATATEAAVAVITEVVVAIIVVHAIPGEAILTTNATEAAAGGDPVHMTHHSPCDLDDTTISHDLTKDIDLTHTARADLSHWEEDTAIIPIQSLQIANAPGMLRDLPLWDQRHWVDQSSQMQSPVIEAVPWSQLQFKLPKLLYG